MDVGHPMATSVFGQTLGSLVQSPELLWNPGTGGIGGLKAHLRKHPMLFTDVVIILNRQDRAQTLNVNGEPWVARIRRAFRAAWSLQPGRPDVRLNVRVVTDGAELGEFELEPGQFVTVLAPYLWAGPTSRSRAVAQLDLRTAGAPDVAIGTLYDDQLGVSIGGHALDTLALPGVDIPALLLVSRTLDGDALEFALRDGVQAGFTLAEETSGEAVVLRLATPSGTTLTLCIGPVGETQTKDSESFLSSFSREDLEARIGKLDKARTARDTVRSNTTVDRVLLRPSGAWVERLHRMPRVEKGELTDVILTGFPADLDPNRIQVTPDTPGVTIESFVYETGTSDDWSDLTRIQDVMATFDALEQDFRTLVDASATQSSLVFRASPSTRSGSNSRTGGLSRLRGAYDARLRQLREEGARLEDELHELLVRAETTVGTGPRLRVHFTSTERVVRLRARYASSQVTWDLSYDVNLSSDDPESVAISLLGQIAQTTQDDWRNVQLAVELGEPEPRLAPPPSSWPIATDADNVTDWMVPVVSEDSDQVFDIPGRHDLRWGEPLRLTLKAWITGCNMLFVVNPRVDPRVFQMAEVSSWTGPPLPPGPCRVLVDDEMVGHGHLQAIEPGERCRVGLGAAKGFVVSRRRLEQDGHHPGTVTYETKVRSNRSEPVRMEVFEDVPFTEKTDEATLATHAKGAEVVITNRRLTFRALVTKSDPLTLDFGFMLPGQGPGLQLHEVTLQ
jgi:hypothetical protein